MNHNARLFAFPLWLGLLWPLTGMADDEGRDLARRLHAEGQILSLEEVLEAVQAEHPGRLLEAEFEHHRGRPIYEIELLEPDGVVMEYLLDATTGELIEQYVED